MSTKGKEPAFQKVKKRADRQKLRREFYASIDRGELDLRQGVRQFRLMLGMTQRQFAAYTEVPARTIMAFEQGKGNPTLCTIAKMLKGSGLNLTLSRKL